MIFDDSEESFIHVEQEFTQVGIQKLRHLHLKYATHVGIVHPLTYIDFKVIRQVLGYSWTSRASGRQTERADCNYLKN